MVSKAPQKKILFAQTKKILLKIRLSIRIRNFAAPDEPLDVTTFLYFNPKVAVLLPP
jgi:hypothetical protein